MNRKIFLVLALVASLAVATNMVGITYAKQGITDNGPGCKSFENRQNPEDPTSESCHSFGHKSESICRTTPPDRDVLASCTKETPP